MLRMSMPPAGSEDRTPADPHPDGRALVLGLGNDILSDDGAGLIAAREVATRLGNDPGVTVCETTEMGLALLDYLVGYETVVILDSIQTGRGPPGTIYELDADALGALTGRTPHFLGVGETMALGRHLGLSMPKTVLVIAVEVQDPFTLGTSLSPEVQAAIPELTRRACLHARGGCGVDTRRVPDDVRSR